MAALDESHVEKKFRNVVTSQESIQSLSMWVVHHKAQHEKIVNIWFNVLKKSKLDHRLTLFYLANDIVQTCRRKHAVMYKDAFKEVMKDATLLVRDNAIKPPIERIFTIWKERGIYDAEFADELVAIINNTKVRATMNSKLLSEFQPLTLMEKVITLKRFEDEIELKRRQLRNLRLDASSIEAVKQLKDRTHGGEFCAEFEGACTKMEDYVKSLEKEISDRVVLIEMLEQSELYYDAQYGEAKIVANAYKNFGTRVNSLKKKLEEKRTTLPDSVSPVGSPIADAPSPSPTSSPEQQLDKRLETAESAHNKDHKKHSEKSHRHHHHHHYHGDHHHKSHHHGDHQQKESEAYDYSLEYRPDSPVPPDVTSPIPLGVTTPEHVPAPAQYDMNIETIDMEMSDEEDTGHNSKPAEKYEVKLNEDIDMSPKSDDDFAGPQGSPILDNEDKKSGYMPSVVKGTTTSFLDEILKTTATNKKDNEDGGSTPVMDEFENSSNSGNGSSEKHDKSKPTKQNPIDFLTQLIGQTKKTKSSSSSFFENLSLLTKSVKSQHISEEKEENNSQQTTADSWAAWKAQNAPPPPLESPAPIAPPLPQQNLAPNSALISPDMPPVTKIHPTLLPPPTPPFQSPMPPPPFPPPPGSEVPYPAVPLQRQNSGSYPGPNTPGNNIFPPQESSGYTSFESGQQSNNYAPTTPVNSNYPGAPSQGPNFENDSSSYRPPVPGQPGFPPLPPVPPGLRFPPPPRLPESGYPPMQGQESGFNQPPLPPPPVSSTSSPTFSPPVVSQSVSYPSSQGQTSTPPSPYPPPLTPGAPIPPRPHYTPDNSYGNPSFPSALSEHGQLPFPPPSPSSFGAPGTPNQPSSSRPFLRPPPTPPVVGGQGARPFPLSLHRPAKSSQSQSNWAESGPSPTHSSGQFRTANQRSNLTTIKTVDDSEFDRGKSQQHWSARSPGHPPFQPRAPSKPPSLIASIHGNKNNFSSGGEGQQEFIEKLKRKSNPGDSNGPPNHSMGDHFNAPVHSNAGSNLRTLTQVTMDISSGESVTVSTVSTSSSEINTTTSASTKTINTDNEMEHSDNEPEGGNDSKSKENSSFEDKTSESETDTIGQHVGGFLQRLRAETEKGPKTHYRDETEYSDFSEDTEEGMSPFKSRPPFEGGRDRDFHPRHQFRMRNPRGGGMPPRSYLPPDGVPPLHRMPFGDRPPFRRGMGRPPRGPYGPTGMGPHRGMGHHPGDFRPKRPPPLLGRHGGGTRPFFPHPRY